MKLLAIDAATEACSVALSVGDTVFERHEIAPRGHAQRLLSMVDEVLQESGLGLGALDAIAFDRGPGSFTGVRVGTSVTQGLAFGADLPVVPVSSLATLAQGAWREHGQVQVLSLIDARMGEVYWGYYRLHEGVMRLEAEEHVSPTEAIQAIAGDWYGAGTGWQAYAEGLEAWLKLHKAFHCLGQDGQRLPQAVDILTQAKALFAAGTYVTAEQALPTYLRNEVAHKPS